MSSPADPVLTLDDLAHWSSPGDFLAVLGHPIGHSRSPAMHNAALAQLAVTDARFRDWRYVRFDIPPDQLPRALPLFHARGFRGLNLTVPHKVVAFDLVAAIDPAARPIGAVNTLLRTPEGWRGYNTDGYGLATAVREELGLNLAGTPVILLGAGGAARGAAVECLQRGCASLAIANRTRARLDILLAALDPVARLSRAPGAAAAAGSSAPSIPVRGFDPATPPRDLPERALVINATSAGLRDSDPLPIDLAALPRPAAVYDMIYQPPRTPLLRTAESLGLPVANGLGMLVHQGAKALEIWTGIPAARTAPAMRTALAAG